jgi:hypothetical protein
VSSPAPTGLKLHRLRVEIGECTLGVCRGTPSVRASCAAAMPRFRLRLRKRFSISVIGSDAGPRRRRFQNDSSPLTVGHHHVLGDFVILHRLVGQILSNARLFEATVRGF